MIEKEKSYKRKLFDAILGLSIILTIFGVGYFVGILQGADLVIPENITIGLDEEQMYELEKFPERLKVALESSNTTCNYNVTGGEELYKYIEDKVYEDIKRDRNSVEIVNTFCKRSDATGKLYSSESRELILLDLNDPKEINGLTYEIVGGDTTNRNIMLDINGDRKTLEKGDYWSNKDIILYVEDIFLTDIPMLGASAKIEFMGEGFPLKRDYSVNNSIRNCQSHIDMIISTYKEKYSSEFNQSKFDELFMSCEEELLFTGKEKFTKNYGGRIIYNE